MQRDEIPPGILQKDLTLCDCGNWRNGLVSDVGAAMMLEKMEGKMEGKLGGVTSWDLETMRMD